MASSWEPVDLGPYIQGELVNQPPTMVRRSDGRPILYPNLTWLSGPPESVKTWFALIACVEAMGMGGQVIYIDFEGEPAAIIERLRALGLEDTTIIDHFHYVRPEDPLTAKVAAQVALLAKQRLPHVSVIDGVNDGMGASGFDSNHGADFYKWWGMLGTGLMSWTSGPILAIDHVVKDVEARKQYASGTGQKLAKVDVHLGFEMTQDFGRGLTGRAEIHLHKDRAGHLRAIAEKKLLGKLVLVSHSGGNITWEIEPPTPTRDANGEPIAFRPTVLMERISKHLERVGTEQTQRSIRTSVNGDNNAMKTAVDVLVDEGYVVQNTKGTWATYRHSKPFREKTDPVSKGGLEWSESGLSRPANGSGLRSVSPLGGQTGTDHDQGVQTTPSGLRSETDRCPACFTLCVSTGNGLVCPRCAEAAG